MSTDTDRHWNEWGARDPYFGVLGAPQFHAQSIGAHRDAFFASGQATIARILGELESSFGPGERARVLDFGCGVGRLTLPLSRQFAHVTAIDVAATMRAEAARNAEAAGYDNIRFLPAAAPLLQAGDRFDLIVSCMVLQHVPVRDGMVVLDNLLRLLAPGGQFWLEMTVRRLDGRLRRAAYWANHHFAPVRYITNLRHGLPWDMPPVQMNEYDLPSVLHLCSDHGVRNLRVHTEFHGRVLAVALFGRLGTPPAG